MFLECYVPFSQNPSSHGPFLNQFEPLHISQISNLMLSSHLRLGHLRRHFLECLIHLSLRIYFYLSAICNLFTDEQILFWGIVSVISRRTWGQALKISVTGLKFEPRTFRTRSASATDNTTTFCLSPRTLQQKIGTPWLHAIHLTLLHVGLYRYRMKALLDAVHVRWPSSMCWFPCRVSWRYVL